MDIRAILAGLAFALIWSSAFTSARIIVADAPPILSLSLRFLISGLYLVCTTGLKFGPCKTYPIGCKICLFDFKTF